MNTIEINSQNAKTPQSHILRYEFSGKFQLPEYCRLGYAIIPYAWHNISDKFKNNRYSINGTEVIIPNGFYTVRWLNEFIIWDLEYNHNIKIEYDIIVEDEVSIRIQIRVEDDIGDFIIYDQLAYMLGIVETKKDAEGKSFKFENGHHKNVDFIGHMDHVENIKINCSLVQNEYQADSNLLYTWKPNTGYGRYMEVEPRNFWKPCRATDVTYIELWMTNQDDEPLDVRDNMYFIIVVADEKFVG